jgi:hypothetical protein
MPLSRQSGNTASKTAFSRCDLAVAIGADGPSRARPVPCNDGAQQGLGCATLLRSDGTGIRDARELAPSAAEALRLVQALMKLRRPGVRIEDERGNPVSVFQLKDMAQLEARKERPLISKASSRCARRAD